MIRLVPIVVLLLLSAAGPPADDAALATVNGRKLTGRDLRVSLALRGVPEETSPAFHDRAVKELVDRELVRQFLERNKVAPDPQQLALAVRTAKERLAAGGKDPDKVLKSLRTDEARLSEEIAVPLGWRRLVNRTVTDKQVREHFERNRRRLDGTRLRVSQIFRKYEPEESLEAAPKAIAQMKAIRDEIASGKASFAEAAKKYSQSPTAKNGGDLGKIGSRGDVPAAVAEAAFRLDAGQVSDVILSPLGAHLVTVTEVEPGELSLEDARPAIVEELSHKLWDETVAAERKGAKITVENR
jgi:parvulin-like peptidyl-prolyl isomerase